MGLVATNSDSADTGHFRHKKALFDSTGLERYVISIMMMMMNFQAAIPRGPTMCQVQAVLAARSDT